MKRNDQNIGVIGLWHLGSVTSACLAKLGFNVTGFDFDKKVVSNLQKGIPPIFEPQLKELIDSKLNKNLFFTKDIDEVCKDKDYIFITFDLPVDDHDRLSTQIIDKALNILFKRYSQKTTIIISSQVPLGFCRRWLQRITKKTSIQPKIIYFPENIRLGQSIDSFLKPDRVILGVEDHNLKGKFINDFSMWKCPILTMNFESAEMVKHALNSYLATSISFSSEMTDLAEILGANMQDVIYALKTDKRVSVYAPINPGLGFSGGTLGRDVQSLIKLAKKNHYQPKLLQTIHEVNQDRPAMLLKKIHSILPSLSGKTIGLLGLTYKPNTDTLRRSMSLVVAEMIDKEKGQVKGYDPVVRRAISGYPYLNVCESIDDFFKRLDLVILMTEWQDFLDLPVAKIGKLMRKKAIIDTKNFLNKEQYQSAGFIYKGIGF